MQQPLYKFRFRDSAGALIGELGYSHQSDATSSGVSWFQYYKHVTGAGYLEMELNGDLAFLSGLDEDGQIEVWRKVDDEDWYIDFLSLNVGDYEKKWPDGIERYLYRGPGKNDLLSRAIVAWYAGYASRSSFTSDPAETIMKTLVTYNLTASATIANGREDTFTSNFTITAAADAAGGNSVDWFCSWDNVLESLSALSKIGGGDYSLTRDPDSDGSYTKFEFRFHAGQLGTDRTATVKFSLPLGNMANPVIRRKALNTSTAAIVGGPGEGSARLITVRDASSHTSDRHREMFVNAPNTKTTAGRQAAGDSALEQHQPLVSFSWDVLQTKSLRYGVEYVLGDLATAIRPDTSASTTQKITGVRVAMNSDGVETIKIDTEQQ